MYRGIEDGGSISSSTSIPRPSIISDRSSTETTTTTTTTTTTPTSTKRLWPSKNRSACTSFTNLAFDFDGCNQEVLDAPPLPKRSTTPIYPAPFDPRRQPAPPTTPRCLVFLTLVNALTLMAALLCIVFVTIREHSSSRALQETRNELRLRDESSHALKSNSSDDDHRLLDFLRRLETTQNATSRELARLRNPSSAEDDLFERLQHLVESSARNSQRRFLDAVAAKAAEFEATAKRLVDGIRNETNREMAVHQRSIKRLVRSSNLDINLALKELQTNLTSRADDMVKGLSSMAAALKVAGAAGSTAASSETSVPQTVPEFVRSLKSDVAGIFRGVETIQQETASFCGGVAPTLQQINETMIRRQRRLKADFRSLKASCQGRGSINGSQIRIDERLESLETSTKLILEAVSLMEDDDDDAFHVNLTAENFRRDRERGGTLNPGILTRKGVALALWILGDDVAILSQDVAEIKEAVAAWERKNVSVGVFDHTLQQMARDFSVELKQILLDIGGLSSGHALLNNLVEIGVKNVTTVAARVDELLRLSTRFDAALNDIRSRVDVSSAAAPLPKAAQVTQCVAALDGTTASFRAMPTGGDFRPSVSASAGNVTYTTDDFVNASFVLGPKTTLTTCCGSHALIRIDRGVDGNPDEVRLKSSAKPATPAFNATTAFNVTPALPEADIIQISPDLKMTFVERHLGTQPASTGRRRFVEVFYVLSGARWNSLAPIIVSPSGATLELQPAPRNAFLGRFLVEADKEVGKEDLRPFMEEMAKCFLI